MQKCKCQNSILPCTLEISVWKRVSESESTITATSSRTKRLWPPAQSPDKLQKDSQLSEDLRRLQEPREPENPRLQLPIHQVRIRSSRQPLLPPWLRKASFLRWCPAKRSWLRWRLWLLKPQRWSWTSRSQSYSPRKSAPVTRLHWETRKLTLAAVWEIWRRSSSTWTRRSWRTSRSASTRQFRIAPTRRSPSTRSTESSISRWRWTASE